MIRVMKSVLPALGLCCCVLYGGFTLAADMEVDEELILEEQAETESPELSVSGQEEMTEGLLVEEADSFESVLPSENPGYETEAGEEFVIDGIEIVSDVVEMGTETADSESETELPAGDEETESGTESAASEADNPKECGAHPGTVYWTLDEDGVLTVYGEGAMADWESGEQAPWYPYYGEIHGIVIADGVTSVGAYAFCDASGIESVDMADSVSTIGTCAFSKCSGLTSVSIG